MALCYHMHLFVCRFYSFSLPKWQLSTVPGLPLKPKTSFFNATGIVRCVMLYVFILCLCLRILAAYSLIPEQTFFFWGKSMNFRLTCVSPTGPLTESFQSCCTEHPHRPIWRHPGPSTFVAQWKFLFLFVLSVKCIFLYFALNLLCAHLCNTAVNKSRFFQLSKYRLSLF